MSFFNSLWSLAMASLMLQAVSAQVCYYPDGLTTSDDVACSNNPAGSSCCPTGSFCMDNGLCFGGGIVSRSSCTDQTWASAECAQYCTEGYRSSTVGLTACNAESRTFTCGIDNTQCQNSKFTFVMAQGNALVLRPAQVEALAAGYSTPAGQKQRSYGVGTLMGVALGIGLPLSFALMMALLVLRKEKQRFALNCMFEQQNLHVRNGPRAHSGRSFSTVSKSGTLTTIESASTYVQRQPEGYMQKDDHQKGYHSHSGDIGVPVYELSSGPPERRSRIETP